LKPSSPRLWLIVFTVFAVIAMSALTVWAVSRSARPQGGPCPPNCMVTFQTPSIFSPGSAETGRIDALFRFILIVAGIIFVLVEGMLLFAVLRFRNRPPEAAMQFHGNTKLELAWTAAPAVILAVLLGFTLQTMGQVKAVAPPDAVHITVVGHQWWWEFRYPDLGVVTADEFVVPVNTVIDISVQSADVEHGFWVPELFGKVDAIPGYTNRIRFIATEARRDYYGGQCTQFCGDQHAQMRFAVVVRSAAEFQDWINLMKQDAATGQTGAAATGAQLFASSGCTACHTVNGVEGAVGTRGPNLTHVASRSFIAGGVLANTPDNLRAWVKDAPGVKPGAIMPSFSDPSNPQPDLTDDQVNALVAYLQTLH
jgi:cytochrome c oxidase subunit 2